MDLKDNEKNCYICNYENVDHYRISGKPMYRVQCPRCGEYFISDVLLKCNRDEKLKDNGYVFSSLSREFSEKEMKSPEFTVENLDKYLDHYLIPDLSDIKSKSTKLLEYLRARSEYYTHRIQFIDKNDYSLCYAKNEREFLGISKFLEDIGLIDRSVSSGGDAVCLTVDGWDFVGEKDKKDNNNGFIALWFENPNGDKIIKCMNDGIREAGYEPVCIKGSYFSGKIMDKALAEIKKSKFIVIDLTGERSSVF